MKTIYILFVIFIAGCTPPGKPVPPAPNADNSFDKLYGTHCAGCHGADGKYGSAPPLNDLLYQEHLSEDQLSVITNGRAGTAMPPFAKAKGGPLTPQQIQALTTGMMYEWRKGYLFDGWGPYRLGDGIARGKVMYEKYCASCHGVDGKGSTTAGAINSPTALALTSNEYLWRICKIGRTDLGCFPEATKADLDANDLTAFLASWRRQP